MGVLLLNGSFGYHIDNNVDPFLVGHTSVEVGTLHLLTHVLAGCHGYGTVSVEIYDGKVHGGSLDASWTVNKVYSCSEADVVCISLVRLYIILTIQYIGLLRVY